MTDLVITAAATAEKLERGDDFILLDCREPEELQIASIEGAVSIPMGEIPMRLQELDPDKEYVVVCHHGVRSGEVAGFLRANDFSNVLNLRGGIDAWSREVDATVPLY